jgi:subtilisin family serine protease
VDNSSVSSLGCGSDIITVANLDEARQRIARTSSQGPTRDGRNKPDIAAPGTDIVAAKGFAGQDDVWVSMSGTSMASPVVTGLAALMLGIDRQLTAAQIKAILHRTAVPLPGGSYAWVNDAGFGRLNPKAALAEAAHARDRKERSK